MTNDGSNDPRPNPTPSMGSDSSTQNDDLSVDFQSPELGVDDISPDGHGTFLTFEDETFDWGGLEVRPCKFHEWFDTEGNEKSIYARVISRVVGGHLDEFVAEYGVVEWPSVPPKYEVRTGEFREWERGVSPGTGANEELYWVSEDPRLSESLDVGMPPKRLDAALREVTPDETYDPEEVRVVVCGMKGFLVTHGLDAVLVSPTVRDV